MMIPREIIEEIIDSSDIYEIVGRYVTLKRAGSNWAGLCPFHSEKTPSFTVLPGTKSCYCFGCGAGGDVITFIMKIENLDYVSAVEYLAKNAGITIPQQMDDTERGIPRKRVYEMNLAAARFFSQSLMDPKIGAAGMDYLRNKRKLSVATIRHFGLGFAPNGFDLLGAHMRKLGYSEEELKECYLRGKSSTTGRYFDMFRNRVIFPIIDTSGNVIAFGGRVLDDSKPKYLNSSDTPAFKKSKNLFALNFAKNHCSENLILCEGYMDVIALHAAGFENAVATLGTAITPEQARVFSRYTKKVIITYDSDQAGQTAAEKAMRLLGEVGLEVRVLKLSGAKDPDEFIRAFGKDSFRRALEGSRTGFDYRSDSILSRYDIAVASDKIRAVSDLCKLMASYPSASEREVYIQQVSKKTEMPADVLRADVERARKKLLAEWKKEESKQANLSARNIGDHVNPDAAKNIIATSSENVILGLLMLFAEYREAVASGKISLNEEDFFSSFGKRAFHSIMELHNSEHGFAYSFLGESFSPDEMGRLQKMIRDRTVLTENGPEVFKQSVETLKGEILKKNAKEGQDTISGIEAILKKKGRPVQTNESNNKDSQ